MVGGAALGFLPGLLSPILPYGIFVIPGAAVVTLVVMAFRPPVRQVGAGLLAGLAIGAIVGAGVCGAFIALLVTGPSV